MDDTLRAWPREKYIVLEKETVGMFNRYEFIVNNQVIQTITPKSHEEQDDLLAALDEEKDIIFIESLIENISSLGYI
ncbi:hypothetical protein [Oceanobacillus kimchii]|uniref:Uncharacterized protein n=1 Tax=Oceanobacillus kimchii TaxID=746691 RepID=A0ABQ5TKF1_9BACI|nr:hypothetical protein [Oceanobacillus kimchii]GLO66103.1 hypothetical protein MACH08_18870 [Oceanobacillus kimchii]